MRRIPDPQSYPPFDLGLDPPALPAPRSRRRAARLRGPRPANANQEAAPSGPRRPKKAQRMGR
jgi:hypothetical protein